MRLVVLSGFLGSGKTTLLGALAPRLVDDPAKLVIIENEVGNPGLDSAILGDRGLAVREVFGGCICCTLRLNLRQALYEIVETYRPEVVLIEPSGVADPADVVATAAETGLPFDRIDLVCLIDAERFERIRLVCGPFLERSVARADIAVINKADAVTPAALATLTGELRTLRPEGPLLAISAREGTGLDALFALLAEPVTHHGADIGVAGGVKPVTIARQQALLPGGADGARLVARVVELHRWLAGVLVDAGQPVEGHIKSRLETPDGRAAMIQTTALDRPARIDGALDGPVDAARLTFNAVLVGAGAATVTALVEAELARLTAGG